MDELSFVQSNDGWSVVVLSTGKSYTFDHDHPEYGVLLQALDDQDLELFESHINIVQAVETYVETVNESDTDSGIEVVDGVVLYNGQPLHNSMTTRIVENMRAGVPYENMLKFLKNLMDNPSFNSVKQLYSFLEKHALPITSDGHFLAYKTVDSNFYDKYTQTIKNSVGEVVTMDRNLIDDDSAKGCSQGLHAGGLHYAGPGGTYNSSDDNVVIVKINPRDAVSVPNDFNQGKLRTCRYEVVSLYNGPMVKPCYKDDASELDSYREAPEVQKSIYTDFEDLRVDDSIKFESWSGDLRYGVVYEIDYEYDEWDDHDYTCVKLCMSNTDNEPNAYVWFDADDMCKIEVL